MNQLKKTWGISAENAREWLTIDLVLWRRFLYEDWSVFGDKSYMMTVLVHREFSKKVL